MKKGKFGLFISLFTVAIFATSTTIQAQLIERTMSLNELFELADNVSLTIKSAESSARVADAAVKVSKNGLLPDIVCHRIHSYGCWYSGMPVGVVVPTKHLPQRESDATVIRNVARQSCSSEIFFALWTVAKTIYDGRA